MKALVMCDRDDADHQRQDRGQEGPEDDDEDDAGDRQADVTSLLRSSSAIVLKVASPLRLPTA